MADVWRNRRRILLPVLLIALGTYLLAGCIPLPLPGNFKSADGKVRPEKQIGKPASGRSVRLGESDWNQVLVYLGDPTYVTADRSAMVYQYDVNTFTLFFPFCFWLGEYSMDKTYADRFLLLRFDEEGKLKSYRVYKDLKQVRAQVPVALDETQPEGPARRYARPLRPTTTRRSP